MQSVGWFCDAKRMMKITKTDHDMNKFYDKTKKVLGLSMAGAAVLPLVASCGTAEEKPKEPMNILFIMCDDHSYQTISAYDTTFIRTPNIDRIAADGLRFTNSFVANSISGPSRACMLTGKHSYTNGFTDNSSSFDGGQQTFPKLLQQQGYETAVIGKWHLTSEPTGFNHWDILIGQVASIGHPCAVRCLMMQKQTERLAYISPALKPVECKVGSHVGGITLALHFLSVANESGVIIVALSNEHIPMVEACRLRCQVPLANDRSLIALLLQELGECLLAAVERRAVVGETVGEAVLAGEHTGT